MANTMMSAAIASVKDAEEIIKTDRYGEDLDAAIFYLQQNDPQNKVLAEIASAGALENIELFKAMNAQKRAEIARKNNDYEELAEIAKFLNLSNNWALRREAMKILQEMPEVQDNPQTIDLINQTIDNTARMQQMQAKQDIVRNATPSMSDDEIMENAASIDSITTQEFEDKLIEDTVKKAQKTVTITDSEGDAIDEEKSDNMWIRLAKQKIAEAAAMSVDDAAFAAKDEKAKISELYERASSNLWADLYRMAGVSAVDSKENEDKNAENVSAAMDGFNQGRPTSIKADAFDSSYVGAKERIANKAEGLNTAGKKKSGFWLSCKLQKLSSWSEKHLGMTPVEYGKALLGAFTTRRGMTGMAASIGVLATSYISIPVAIGAAATYGVYQAVSSAIWPIWEKKHNNYKKAKAKGDADEMSIWKGTAGFNRAYKSIMANPVEKKNFKTQVAINTAAGLGSAALIGFLAPTVTNAASLMTARFAASTVRVAAANTNAGYQAYNAYEQYKEDQTADSKKGWLKARTMAATTLLATTAVETFAAYNVANNAAMEHAMGVEHNPENVEAKEAEIQRLTAENEQLKAENADLAKEKADAVEAQQEVAKTSTSVEVPQEWNKEMGINQDQWDTAHKFGDFDDKYNNAYNAQQADENAFVHADGSKMTTEEVVYKTDRIMSLAKARPDGHGGSIARLFDENHREVFTGKDGNLIYADGTAVTSEDIAPECWGSEERVATFRAIYQAVDCGKEVDGIDSGEFNALYKDAVNGDKNAYMDIDECGKVHFIGEVKTVVHHAPAEATVSDATVSTPKPPADGNADSGLTITDKKNEDVMVDDGALIGTKHNVGNTGTNAGQLEVDEKSIKYSHDRGVGFVPGSMVNAGRELGR